MVAETVRIRYFYYCNCLSQLLPFNIYSLLYINIFHFLFIHHSNCIPKKIQWSCRLVELPKGHHVCIEKCPSKMFFAFVTNKSLKW